MFIDGLFSGPLTPTLRAPSRIFTRLICTTTSRERQFGEYGSDMVLSGIFPLSKNHILMTFLVKRHDATLTSSPTKNRKSLEWRMQHRSKFSRKFVRIVRK